jgi:hypothetical protein
VVADVHSRIESSPRGGLASQWGCTSFETGGWDATDQGVGDGVVGDGDGDVGDGIVVDCVGDVDDGVVGAGVGDVGDGVFVGRSRRRWQCWSKIPWATMLGARGRWRR